MMDHKCSITRSISYIIDEHCQIGLIFWSTGWWVCAYINWMQWDLPEMFKSCLKHSNIFDKSIKLDRKIQKTIKELQSKMVSNKKERQGWRQRSFQIFREDGFLLCWTRLTSQNFVVSLPNKWKSQESMMIWLWSHRGPFKEDTGFIQV